MSSNTRCSGLSRQRGYSTSRMASAFSRSKPHWKCAGRRAVLLPRCIVRSVPLEIVGSSGHEKVPMRENRVWSDQEDHEGRGLKNRAASTCGPHSDSFTDTSRRRRSNCSTNNFQTHCRSKS
ncbi:hypothetical protein TNCV_1699151 [Trichonephila clavipes]|nr:hypothetical protein TNCV_1699151 [Trichonephila clavipes]